MAQDEKRVVKVGCVQNVIMLKHTTHLEHTLLPCKELVREKVR